MYHDIAVVSAINRIKAMRSILEKVVIQGQEKNMQEAEILDLKLAPDMFPLLKQFQIFTDIAKGSISRLTDKEVPTFDDTETTLKEIYERIDTTLSLLENTSPEDFKNTENKTIEMSFFPEQHFTAAGYFTEFYIPNFNFHVSTAYAICRNHGFDIGKMDFLRELPLVKNT